MTELKAINGNTDGTKTKKDKTFKFPINFEKIINLLYKPKYYSSTDSLTSLSVFYVFISHNRQMYVNIFHTP